MAESTILTGQFVRISQTPASVGERIIGQLIDLFILILYSIAVRFLLFSMLSTLADNWIVITICFIIVPIWLYPLLCEVFNSGQSLGKQIMNIRVVKLDGSTPAIGSYLLRWLLFPIDCFFSCGLGVLVILLTKNSQRLGDLAGGTMVIKVKNYRKIHVSLDEFAHLGKEYRPTYPQASDLSLEQMNVITRTLESPQKDRHRRIASLSKKIEESLGATPRDGSQERFLQTLLRDYQYYALEDI